MRKARVACLAAVLLGFSSGFLLGACGTDAARRVDADAEPTDAPPAGLDAPVAEVGEVPATSQRDGDPEAGDRALVNFGYVGCGMPYSLYAQFFAPASEEERLPGREGRNAELPYLFNGFSTDRGVEVVWGNCLG